MEDERYYVQCKRQKNQARVPITRCFDCEFAIGEAAGRADGSTIAIGCNFPLRTKRPRISKVSRH
jgi:hypothetical protein